MSDETLEKVKAILESQFGISDSETVQPETKLREDLGGDSLDAVEITMQLEDDFGISILDEDAEKLNTVQQIVDHVDGKLKEKGR